MLGLPQVVALSYADNLAPSLDSLQARLGPWSPWLHSLWPCSLWLHSRGYTHHAYTHYGGTVTRVGSCSLRLQARLGLSDEELRHLATRLPQLLGLSVSANIEPKLRFLQQVLELDEAALRREVLRAPTVLGSSLNNSLRPNAEMWQDQLRAEGLNLGAEVGRRGLLFLCFSHERRTKPRIERLLRAGLPASIALPKLQLSEAKWESWCRYKGV